MSTTAAIASPIRAHRRKLLSPKPWTSRWRFATQGRPNKTADQLPAKRCQQLLWFKVEREAKTASHFRILTVAKNCLGIAKDHAPDGRSIVRKPVWSCARDLLRFCRY